MPRQTLVSSLLTAVAVVGLGMVYAVSTYRHAKLAILADRHLTPSFDVDKGSSAATRRVYVVGDSQISHWPLDCHGNWYLYRSGFSGEATVNIAAATRALFSDIKPELVVVISGGNDVSATSLLPALQRNAAVKNSLLAFEQIILSSKSAGARRVLIFGIEPSRYSVLVKWLLGTSDLDGIRQQINQGLVELCQGSCQVLSLARVLGVKSEAEWKGFLSDGVHLNRKAYEHLSSFIEAEMR